MFSPVLLFKKSLAGCSDSAVHVSIILYSESHSCYVYKSCIRISVRGMFCFMMTEASWRFNSKTVTSLLCKTHVWTSPVQHTHINDL